LILAGCALYPPAIVDDICSPGFCAAVAMTGQRLYNAPRGNSVTLPESWQMTNVKNKWDGGCKS
jgi:hypothetical protein